MKDIYKYIIFIFSLVLLTNINCAQNNSGRIKMEIKIQSSAFKNEGNIPSKFTCDDKNVSPQLSWSTEVSGIRSFALIVDDPDAPGGDFVHWVVYNIPANIKELPEGSKASKNDPGGILMGRNGFGSIGYGGPCPPSGTHRYYFKIYGLDDVLPFSAGVGKKDLLKAMEGHIIARGELMGRYKRSR
jgi:Raf kinase inhibitor-like YbhB/YbcL family protein